jgi:signal transduction histidine kinase
MKRSRLPRVGRVVNRASTYPLLLALVGAAYVFGVVRIDALLGLSSDWLAAPQILAVGLIALVLQPVQRRMQQWVDHVVHGRRTPAYEVLAEVSALSRDTGRTEESLQSLARVVAQSLTMPTATVTVEFADGTLIDHPWPQPTPGEAGIALDRIPVEYRGTRVGFLAIPADSQRRLPPDRRRLLSDLARASGVILHNENLTSDLEHRLRATEAQSAEIRASRWRIVAAQEAERRDLERDLHDDAQPGLTAVRLSLGLLAHLAGTGDAQAVRAAFDQTRDHVDAALRGLRRTLDGLNPQTLGREGLLAALRERAAGLGCAADFTVDEHVRRRRFAPAIEAAVYYCCSEALQNAAKHSPGAPITVSLELQPAPGRLCFAVTDQGPGFEQSQVLGAGGLQNMADRISVAGGVLDVHSAIGAGTRISGWVAVSSPEPDAAADAYHHRM